MYAYGYIHVKQVPSDLTESINSGIKMVLSTKSVHNHIYFYCLVLRFV